MSGIVNSTGAKSGVIGTTVGTVTAASLSGVLPVGVTGGSGLTALGTVTAGNISHTNIVYPTGHVTYVWNTHDVAGNVSIQGTTLTLVTGSSSINTISGRKYMVQFTGSLGIHNQGGSSITDYSGLLYIFQHTSAQNSGATSPSGTYVNVKYGHALAAATTGASNWYLPYLIQYTFTAGTTDEIFWNLGMVNAEASARTSFTRSGYYHIQFFAMEWMP